jgi:hypothetical protein
VEKVKRLFSSPRVAFTVIVAFALVLMAALTISVKRYREPRGAPPEALAHIAAKNRDAAIVAAARQRADSAASTNAAEDLAEARLRGETEAEARPADAPAARR